MIQKLLFVTFAGILSLTAAAQQKPTSNKDSLLTKICDCITAKETKNTPGEIEAVMQECMMSVIMEDPMGNLMDLGVTDFEDQEAMQKFGMTVGIELAKICPAIGRMAIKSPKENITNKAQSIDGKLLKMELDTYQYVVVEDKSGTQFKLMLLEKFNEADSFIKDNSKFVGKSISFQYKEIETYNPKTKSFNFNKVITGYKLTN